MVSGVIMSNRRELSVLLVEDEHWARSLLQDYILSRNYLSLDAIATDGNEAANFLNKHSYDLVFMDINLPFKSGIEILKENEHNPMIIFTTALKEHALEAFQIGAIEYLVKPITESKFNEAVDKAFLYFAGRHHLNSLKINLFDDLQKNNLFQEILQNKYKLKYCHIMVCQLILKGKTSVEILKICGIMPNTLKTYLRDIYSKTIEKESTMASLAKSKLYQLSNFLKKEYEKLENQK
jgi:DNA-binding NarL/FixJ family response regulator